jgi:hypothetical protein
MTGRDLISASLRLIGAIAPGESPEASEASDALGTVNRMLDSWANEPLMLYWEDDVQVTTLGSLTLNGTVSLPAGYEDAIIYNAAIRLAPEYGRSVTQEVALIANDSKAAIKRTNYRPNYLEIETPASFGGVYNITTGEYE